MHRMTKTILLAALAALVLCAPASRQLPGRALRAGRATFDQPLWQGLKLKRVRYIVPWDFYKGVAARRGHELHERRARAQQEVLVMFTARRGCY